MKYTDLIFDLYGTLVDIHTEENDLVWEKTSILFGFYGAHYTPDELRSAFQIAMADREAKAGQSYECFPDIPFEQVMSELFIRKGIDDRVSRLRSFSASVLLSTFVCIQVPWMLWHLCERPAADFGCSPTHSVSLQHMNCGI